MSSFADSQVFTVGMGHGVVTRAPHIISCQGLGSCVVVAIYDARRKIGGIAHIMMPDSKDLNGHHKPYVCADTAIAELLEGLQSEEANLRELSAKIVGGASMFASDEYSSMGVGEQNIISIKSILRKEGIPLMGADVGSNYGRSIEFHLDSGKLIVMAIGREDRQI